MLSFISCKKEKTVWRSNWSAPILNDTLTLNNLVKDSILLENQFGGYNIRKYINVFEFGLKDLISIPDTIIDIPYSTIFNAINLPAGASFSGEIEEHEFNFDGAELNLISLSTGKIKIKIINPLSKSYIYQIDLPGFSKNNVQFTKDFTVPAANNGLEGVFESEIDLSDYDLDLTGVNGVKNNIIQSKVTIKAPLNGGTVSMTKFDTLHLYLDISELSFSYARGYFGNQILSDTITNFINELSNFNPGSILLSDASINLTILNGFKLPAQANLLYIKNKSLNGDINLTSSNNSFQFGTPFNLDPATGTWNTLVSSSKAIFFDNNTSNIVSFIENLGATNEIAYQIQLNPLGNSLGVLNEAFRNSSFKVNLDIDLPLNIGFNDFILKDTLEFNFKQNKESIYLENGALMIDVSNAFPLEAFLNIGFLDENRGLINKVAVTEKVISSIKGSDTKNGLVFSRSKLTINLENSLVDDLEKIKFLDIEVKLDSPNSFGVNSVATIPINAFMSFKIGGKGQVVNQL